METAAPSRYRWVVLLALFVVTVASQVQWLAHAPIATAAQAVLSVAQPLIINAPTAVASRWFPVTERGTAVGIASLAQFVGIILVMVVTPLSIRVGGRTVPGLIPVVMAWYGWASLAAAVLCLALYREGNGARPRGAGGGVRSFLGGVRHLLMQRDVRRILVLFLVGLGIFNAVTTCIDSICRTKGFDVDESGLVGAIMLVGGVAGAVALPLVSDRIRRRKAVLAAALVGVVPGLAGLAWTHDFGVALAFSFMVGFFVTGAGPVGFQFAAEIGGASTESTSQGLMLLAGQVSGLLFVEAMGSDARIGPMMWVFVCLSSASAALAMTLRESPAMARNDVRNAG